MGFLTFGIFFLGVVTVVLSISVAFKFNNYRRNLPPSGARRLSTAISWQLVGEAIIGLGTLVFATAAHFGWLPDWSIMVQSGLRFVMFFATAITTWHLLKTLKNLS